MDANDIKKLIADSVAAAVAAQATGKAKGSPKAARPNGGVSYQVSRSEFKGIHGYSIAKVVDGSTVRHKFLTDAEAAALKPLLK